jgi:hypothetical protein
VGEKQVTLGCDEVRRHPEDFGDQRRIFIRYPCMTAYESRWQVVGFDEQGILTVRFTLRGGWVRAIGAGYRRK